MKYLPMPLLSPQNIWNLWKYINKKDDINACWNWTGSTRPSEAKEDRPVIKIWKHIYYASRIMYFHWYGVDPRDQLVLHTCNNGMCINPHHLKLGNYHDNKLDFFIDGGAPNKGLAKITQETADEIREYAKLHPELSQEKIGEIFNLSQPNISKILKYKIWP